MTTLGKTWATDDSQLNSSTSGKPSLVGDIFGLLSAMTYGLFTVLLKKYCGEEGERADVQKLFGYVGLFTLVALWWLGKILSNRKGVLLWLYWFCYLLHSLLSLFV
ncbi:EamA-like transporter family [Forsythia ovata]|uniref:EamA-like transporter family n=1 Tax=Forsythia ovata TaxID=205694 RepID=A0ABD1XBX4_9LAMI